MIFINAALTRYVVLRSDQCRLANVFVAGFHETARSSKQQSCNKRHFYCSIKITFFLMLNHTELWPKLQCVFLLQYFLFSCIFNTVTCNPSFPHWIFSRYSIRCTSIGVTKMKIYYRVRSYSDTKVTCITRRLAFHRKLFIINVILFFLFQVSGLLSWLASTSRGRSVEEPRKCSPGDRKSTGYLIDIGGNYARSRNFIARHRFCRMRHYVNP